MPITLKDLISSLPEGKQRIHLEPLFVDAIQAFYHTQSHNDTLDKIHHSVFENLILSGPFIEDLKLWCPADLLATNGLPRVNDMSVNDIRKLLGTYFNIAPPNLENENIVLQINDTTTCQTPLYDYQERIRRKVVNLIFNNTERFLIHMPTGSGKTRTAAEIILDFLRLSSGRALLTENIKVLWIAQSEELLLQAAETIKNIIELKATRPMVLKHFYKHHTLNDDVLNESAIIFCGIQKLLRHYQSDIWSKIRNQTYLIIVDEAHKSVADKWGQVLNFFVNYQSVYLLGLTATPGIGNGNHHLLASMYRNNKISVTDKNYGDIDNPVQYLVNQGFLARVQRHDIQSGCVFEDGACSQDASGEFNFPGRTFAHLTADSQRNESIVNIIEAHNAQNKKILVFTCSVEHNRILKNILFNQNIMSEIIDQDTTNRQSIISKFKDGDLNILLNYNVLSTGFDAPNTDICIIARPISSIVQYSQMVGRISRGNKDLTPRTNILYTIKDNLNHGGYDELFNEFDAFYI